VATLLFAKETLGLDEVITALLMNEARWGNIGFSNDG